MYVLQTVKLHENMGKNVSSQPTIILPGDLKKSKTAENFQDDPSFRNCLGDGTAVDTIANGKYYILPELHS